MNTKKIAVFIYLLLLGIIVIPLSPSEAGSNVFVATNLRVDQQAIYSSGDYRAWFEALGYPNSNPGTFTTGWLSINLDTQEGTFGKKFTQVGLMGDSTGIYWFVYSELGVYCLRGNYAWYNYDLDMYLGCKGDPYDLVTIGNYHAVELVTYDQGEWIARVQDQYGFPTDVATFPQTPVRIFQAQANFEEGYIEDVDPFVFGQYVIAHPQYMLWNVGFQEWQETQLPLITTTPSGPTETPYPLYNQTYVASNPDLPEPSICPDHYGMDPNYDQVSHIWFSGTNGIVCDWILFPPITIGRNTIDDMSTSLVNYEPTPGWGHIYNNPYLMFGTLTYSPTVGYRIQFSFNGYSISYFYSMAANRGHQTIYLDGSYLDRIDSRATETRRQIGKTWSMLEGDHTIEVVNDGDGFFDLDSFAVNISTVGNGVYDDTHSQLRYFGNWTLFTNISGAYNNTITRSNDTQSLMRFTFIGNTITYCSSKGPDRGKVAVTIDGVYKGDLDLYSGNYLRQVCHPPYTGLGNNIHIINLMVTGGKNILSTNTYVDVDKLSVTN